MVWTNVPRIRREAHYDDRLVPCFVERPRTIDLILREAAAKSPGGEALVDGKDRFSYADLDRIASEVAAGLIARGIVPGDRVALLISNRAEFVLDRKSVV